MKSKQNLKCVFYNGPNLHVVVDPVNEVGGLSVNAGVSSLSTSVSPRDNSRELVAAHKWATGVTLAGVLTALVKASTDH